MSFSLFALVIEAKSMADIKDTPRPSLKIIPNPDTNSSTPQEINPEGRTYELLRNSRALYRGLRKNGKLPLQHEISKRPDTGRAMRRAGRKLDRGSRANAN